MSIREIRNLTAPPRYYGVYEFANFVNSKQTQGGPGKKHAKSRWIDVRARHRPGGGQEFRGTTAVSFQMFLLVGYILPAYKSNFDHFYLHRRFDLCKLAIFVPTRTFLRWRFRNKIISHMLNANFNIFIVSCSITNDEIWNWNQNQAKCNFIMHWLSK